MYKIYNNDIKFVNMKNKWQTLKDVPELVETLFKLPDDNTRYNAILNYVDKPKGSEDRFKIHRLRTTTKETKSKDIKYGELQDKKRQKEEEKDKLQKDMEYLKNITEDKYNEDLQKEVDNDGKWYSEQIKINEDYLKELEKIDKYKLNEEDVIKSFDDLFDKYGKYYINNDDDLYDDEFEDLLIEDDKTILYDDFKNYLNKLIVYYKEKIIEDKKVLNESKIDFKKYKEEKLNQYQNEIKKLDAAI